MFQQFWICVCYKLTRAKYKHVSDICSVFKINHQYELHREKKVPSDKKIQSSLRIRKAWSESRLSAWRFLSLVSHYENMPIQKYWKF